MVKVVQRSKKEKWRLRTRGVLRGKEARPRLSVFRSNKGLYVQAIDDESGRTLVSVSTAEIKEGNKSQRSFAAGRMVAERLLKLRIEKIVFDRGGFSYHGRIKSFADGVREGGVNF